jgi:hypothetical protein
MDLMSQGPENKDMELRRLHAEADARERDIDDMDARDVRNDTLIERLRREAVVQAEDFATLTERLAAAENEYTDGLTEARRGGQLFGLEGAAAALEGLDKPSPTEAIGMLRARSSEFADGILTDDICLLAARIT